ncbi:hypothetical protein Plim_0113 [Planctopirus limnophila DSM 3776]|uniref:Uncharacterized protein n=1 Tax=Planctopirus limnophila (strain ATCC 43296 / DSM 3776 / IFAM 1008 / Mu 290) TaxID=521674 RepID=D5SN39_PLAL2|nr:hypothetical protein Plim_0113 [Planctopirus limnophila DSM 3776]
MAGLPVVCLVRRGFKSWGQESFNQQAYPGRLVMLESCVSSRAGSLSREEPLRRAVALPRFGLTFPDPPGFKLDSF